MQELLTILSSVGLSGLLVILLREWISTRLKSAIQHEYDQKLETHKAQLQARNEIELARLKADLEIAAAQRTFRFSHVFEKTAEVIASVYRHLLSLRQAVEEYTEILGVPHDDPARNKRREAVSDAFRQLAQYYLPHKIYIPKKSAKKIESVWKNLDLQIANVGMMSMYSRTLPRDALSDPIVEKNLNKMDERFEASRAEIPQLLCSLEDDFQQILGFPPQKANEPTKKETAT